jgi:hypothetical protein
MTDRISIQAIEFSLSNPNDPTEMTLVADACGVGVTLPTGTGRIVRFTEEFLQKYAQSLVGTPVNVLLNTDGDGVTGHSDSVVGTITRAIYDAGTQKVRVFASLWRHYFPQTVEQLINLQKEGKLQVSCEIAAVGNTDDQGVYTPTSGRFTGMGIVSLGADLNNRVLILAEALKTDQEALSEVSKPTTTESVVEPVTVTTTAIMPLSFEWAGEQIAEYLSNSTAALNATVVGTYPNAFFYNASDDSRFKVPFTVDTGGLTFGEPVKVDEVDSQESIILSNGGQNMPTEEEFAEIKASLETVKTEANDWKGKYEQLETTVTAERRARESEQLSLTRLAEVEKIAPYTDDALKQEHLELFKTSDDKTFEAIKRLMLAATEPKGGIASPETVPASDPDADPGAVEAEKGLPAWRAELLATYGLPKE